MDFLRKEEIIPFSNHHHCFRGELLVVLGRVVVELLFISDGSKGFSPNIPRKDPVHIPARKKQLRKSCERAKVKKTARGDGTVSRKVFHEHVRVPLNGDDWQ